MLFLGGLLVLLVNAWVADDAFITFRVLEQMDAGNGIRWNPHERVQAYTHPLWLGMLWLVTRVLPSPYLGALLAGVALTLLAAFLIWRLCRRDLGTATATLALLAFFSSKALMDYGTSGLETSLSFVLLALIVGSALRWSQGAGWRSLFWACLSISALACNRLDSLTLTGPLLAWLTLSSWRRLGPLRTGSAVFLSSLPLVASHAFSFLYYGFPFPNTFYAKILHDGSPVAAVAQGLWYLLISSLLDPLLGLVLVLGLILGLRARSGLWWALGLGLALNLGYILWVGGDFMAGRFLTPALVVALMILLYTGESRCLARLAVVLLVLPLWPTHPVNPFTDRHLGTPILGVADERAFYSDVTAPEACIASWAAIGVCPNHPWAAMGLDLARSDRRVKTAGAVGMLGYFAGTEKIIVDTMGLADALMARLPVSPDSGHRAGHLFRAVPEGYVAGLEQGVNGIKDPELREYYEKLRIITQAPPLSRERLVTALRFNLGHFDHLLEGYRSRQP
jgi:arabinofuranosyltransferase